MSATTDINYQLSDTAAARLNLMFSDTGVVDRDLVHAHRWGVAPSLAGPGHRHHFAASYIHQHAVGRPDYGVPVAGSPTSPMPCR